MVFSIDFMALPIQWSRVLCGAQSEPVDVPGMLHWLWIIAPQTSPHNIFCVQH